MPHSSMGLLACSGSVCVMIEKKWRASWPGTRELTGFAPSSQCTVHGIVISLFYDYPIALEGGRERESMCVKARSKGVKERARARRLCAHHLPPSNSDLTLSMDGRVCGTGIHRSFIHPVRVKKIILVWGNATHTHLYVRVIFIYIFFWRGALFTTTC